eukprot:TRINITY_DN45513_c0_g1_i1.p1 TRINITY_DN45513_c0_g1~~TRINITY_DN45513_c0_g1_i1.p1  ORF type:complete len:286 (+),score=31.72 TRINITY_DN45513_c0_g1_i1:190-1047(+)
MTTYCKEWASADGVSPLPSDQFLTVYMVSLSLGALLLVVVVTAIRPKGIRRLLQDAGVAIQRVANTAKEIERKVFHLCGLLVPLIYQMLLNRGYSRSTCCMICWVITITGCGSDMLRIYVPFVQRNWPLRGILRDSEQHRLCGGSYFALGCTLAITFFAPVIAMTSIIFLVLGDMSAALIGRSFGKNFVSLGIGPDGKKSVEGSAAMFVVCLLFGLVLFSQVHLREYAVVIGALAATLVELYEPFGINDNVTIPLISCLALTFGFARTYSCDPTRNPLLWHAKFG